MRLDKYLVTVTDLSRSMAKKLIKEGRVAVDEERQTSPAMAVAMTAEVKLDDEILRMPQLRYFMLNKPQGYVSATKDRQHPTVLDLLDEDNLDRLHIAGRLDIDTTGLVLITDDGQWSHRVTSPGCDCKKTYLLETTEPITAEAIIQIAQGIHLKNEKRPTLPATLILLDEHTARLTLQEGKYHQVKRMLAAVGNKVDILHREKIGVITLDESLLPGEYRPLTPAEVAGI